jgi:hypothetical protein
MNEEPRRVQPRPNIATGQRLSFRKRYEAVGYRALLAITLRLIIWFLAASAANRGKAQEIELTAIATLFVPETATAEAELEAEGR